jgi:hypothetical protein
MRQELQELKALHRDRRLCLFVGAGVSRSCGLPHWPALSQAVIKAAWPDRVTSYDYEHIALRSMLQRASPLDAMRHARAQLGDKFNLAVKRALYVEPISASETLCAITRLTRIVRVCCFNYDDMLESAILASGRNCSPICEGDELNFHSEQVLIFHPHGFLPSQPSSRSYDSMRIVLSEDDYHNLYSALYSWANIVQIVLLHSYSVLFLGMSLTDPNTRRLLDLCRQMQVAQKHFALLRNPGYHPEAKGWEGLAYTGLDKFEAEFLLRRGVTAVWFNEYGEIAELLNELAV